MRKIIVTEDSVVTKTTSANVSENDANDQDTKSNVGAKKVNHVNTGKNGDVKTTAQIVGNVKLSKFSILLVALLDQLMDLAAQYIPQFVTWIETLIQ